MVIGNVSEVSSLDLYVLSIYSCIRVLEVYVPNIRFLILGCTHWNFACKSTCFKYNNMNTPFMVHRIYDVMKRISESISAFFN